jgi:LPXTG-motif cell wall-anchored protein
LGTRRPLTTTAVAAGIGIAAALTLGPMASAATASAARHDVQSTAAHPAKAPKTAKASKTGATGSTGATKEAAGFGSGMTLADTGVDTTPYTVGGLGSLVLGAGLVYAARRAAAA